MQKKIIALAVAAALTAPAMAFAEATVYGIMDGSVDFITTGDGVPSAAATKGTSIRRISANQSRLGFKGSEDLGDGMSAIWQLESKVDFMGGGIASTRNTFVGLKTGGGTIIIGQIDTPYKSATRKLDVFGDHIGDNRALMGGGGKTSGSSFDARNAETIYYKSPKLGDLTIAAALVQMGAAATTLDTTTKNTAMSLAGMYDAAPLYVAVAYENHKSSPAAGTSTAETGTRLGVGYKQDAITVGFTFEKTKDDYAAGGNNMMGHTGMNLGVAFAMSNNDSVKVSYTKVGEIGSPTVSKSGATQIAVGFDHKMSKNTTMYASYAKLSNDDAAQYGLFSSKTNNAGAVVGGDPSGLSLGLKIVF